MGVEPDNQPSDEGVEQEIRQARKFTPQEALARLAGPGAMKGASPVSPLQQARTEVGTWIRDHVADPAGALQMLLHRNVSASDLLCNDPDRPLEALADYCRRVLASDYMLEELVREADVEWGRRMDERPYFERENSPPNPNDPYTFESVRGALDDVVARLS